MSKKYQILDAVGHGGMANVYRARDLDLEREVAVKELSEQLMESERFVQQFLSEARKMASISHPNVLPIFSIDDDGQQRPRLVMELAESSLAEQIGDAATEPVLVERIGRQVLQGLEAIHDAGLVHRDIKPANIFYSRGFYKIGDFGIATDGEEQTQLLATPKYMAPEVLNRPHLVGPASDLYSLGLILYEALVGTARFEAAVAQVVDAETASPVPPPPGARKHLWRTFHGSARELPPPRQLDSEIPEPLSRWISKLTRKDIGQRFQSCREALTTLNRGARGSEEAYGAADVTQPVSPAKKKGLGPLQIGLIIAIVATLLAAGGFFAWRYNRPIVTIASEPEGATIYFDGEEVGPTPKTGRMRVGATVELRKEGFEPAELTLEDRTTPTLEMRLKWRPVEIRSEPAGARVMVAGELRGATPYQVVGEGEERIDVSLELAGYEAATLEVAPGTSPPPVILKPDLAELPEGDATSSPDRLAEALRGFLTSGGGSHLALDGGDGSRVRFGQAIRLRASVQESLHAAAFLLLSTGDAVLLYPSGRAGGLRLEPGGETLLPLPEHARRGYRLEASEPAGRDLAFLLTAHDPLPEPPAGEPLGPWMTYFVFQANDDRGPALALVRWAAGVRRAAAEDTELAMTEILVESGP